MPRRISRRRFLQYLAAGGAIGGALSFLEKPSSTVRPKPFKPSRLSRGLAVARDGEPRELLRRVLQGLGGLDGLVSRGDRVFIKPCMSWDRSPEQAANTHPEIVAELVRLSLDCGARDVLVADNPPGRDPARPYASSGVERAARQADARVRFMREEDFVRVEIPGATGLREWSFYRPALECDVFINIPVVKQHQASLITCSLKGMMGILGGARGRIHQNLHEKIVDMNRVVAVDLTVVDATRVLVRHGPTGGDLADVRHAGTVLASTDRVAADAYACSFLPRLRPERVGHIALASGVLRCPGGTCTMDYASVGVIEA